MESILHQHDRLHVAVIMDGNGRWARARGRPRTAGHRAGVAAVRRVVAAAPELGIATLTLFAFSCDNWRRPAEEVDALLWLMRAYLRSATRQFVEKGVRLRFIGRRDRLPPLLEKRIAEAEAATAGARRLHLRIALDYSSRDAITRAALRSAQEAPPTLDGFGRRIDRALAESGGAGAVDLLIRTGGEKRLSDFLLWESAYAELWFTDTMWPDFDAAALGAAVADFRGRERRFGGLGAAAGSLALNRGAAE
jgi:undecaprenyl diphosphate synthase